MKISAINAKSTTTRARTMKPPRLEYRFVEIEDESQLQFVAVASAHTHTHTNDSRGIASSGITSCRLSACRQTSGSGGGGGKLARARINNKRTRMKPRLCANRLSVRPIASKLVEDDRRARARAQLEFERHTSGAPLVRLTSIRHTHARAHFLMANLSAARATYQLTVAAAAAMDTCSHILVANVTPRLATKFVASARNWPHILSKTMCRIECSCARDK